MLIQNLTMTQNYILITHLIGTAGRLVGLAGLACLVLALMQTAVMTTDASDATRQLATATPTMTPGTAPPLNVNASLSPISTTPSV